MRPYYGFRVKYYNIIISFNNYNTNIDTPSDNTSSIVGKAIVNKAIVGNTYKTNTSDVVGNKVDS